MTEQRLTILIEHYLDESLSDSERVELADALHDPVLLEQAGQMVIQQLQTGRFNYQPDLEVLYQRIESAVAVSQEKKLAPVHRIHFMKRGWVRITAAAVILFAVAGTYFLLNQTQEKPTNKSNYTVFKTDVQPGRTGAKVKLADGRIILTDTLKDGLIAMQGAMQIVKENGQIVYKGNTDEVAYNEIIVDKGRIVTVELPDHSIAYVNSGSSIRYPLHFAANERKVIMTGRAAFRVQHDEMQPFRVYAKNQIFEDKGTEFNIDAYDDEPIMTMTVREGIVKTGSTIIKANQQARISNGNTQLINNIDTDQIFAWTKNRFVFSDASIEEIMKEAARWYDVEVVYEGKINQSFIFNVDRNKPISGILHKMELGGGVHFEIEGKRIIVKP
ncbi:MAG: FecR domain-containing protein [Bacteroidota bacterium]